MRITEGQLRRIIREELNEMKGTSKYGSGPFDPEVGYVDDPGSPRHGHALKSRIAASPLSPRFYAAKEEMGGYPDLSAEELEGAEFERGALERPSPFMFTGTESDNIALFNDELNRKLPMKGRMFNIFKGRIKTNDFFGTYEIKRVPGEPELFEASVIRGKDPLTVAGVASADTPYEAVENAVKNAVENASYGRGSPFYGSF